ncbi:hypothetical protein AB1N83_005656 [Pleurotus pulmonarius]
MVDLERDCTHLYYLDYAVPPLVESIGVKMFQSWAVVSVLLAANAAVLLALVQDNDNFSSTPAGTCPPFLLILAYMAVVINSCSAVTAMVIIDKIGDLSFKSACLTCSGHSLGRANTELVQTLRAYGTPWSIFRFILAYWLVLFISGFVITVAEILLLVTTEEVKWVEIVLSIMAII